jgi:hypothetical protein
MAAHRRRSVILGATFVLSLVFVSAAWALPAHDYDMGWGKGGLHSKPDYGKPDYDYGHSGSYEKHGKYGNIGKHKSGLEDKYKGHDGYDFVKWGKGYGKDDPDCDPPVSSPEPGTLLLLGSTFAGLGVYARRRRQATGG